MSKVDIQALMEAGVHFGHRTEKWNPKMKPYIYSARNGIYVIDLTKTVEQLENAVEFLKKTVSDGGKPIFVGCKKQAKDAIRDLCQKNQSFYVTERWLGGTLTNLNTIRKSVARMQEIDDLEKSGKIRDLPKQEAAALRRENQKLHRNLDGVRDMVKIPAVMVVIDPSREEIAVREARKLNIPVIAIVDTNADPDMVDYPIPGNDDAIRSVKIILDYLHNAVVEGKAEGGKRNSKKEKETQKETVEV